MRAVFFLCFFPLFLQAQFDVWQTGYEKSGFKATPRYAETIDYCKRLADASPWIDYQTFGVSPQGRALPLLIADRYGNFTPEKVRRTSQVVFMIQAGIHSGEIDGKDAGLMLLREIAITKKLENLLDNVTILFIPIFNVDGHERFSAYSRANQNGPEKMGWRTTAQNLNLNRDYLKADAPEMQRWLKLFDAWLPDFFADCHVTDGADYQYAITYKIDQHGIIDPLLVDWIEKAYLPPLYEKMTANGFPLVEYVALRNRNDLKDGMVTWAAPPRFSDGYAAIQNRPGLLIETHMFKDYKTRVDATYEILKQTLHILNQERRNLREKIMVVDEMTSQPAFRDKPYPLTYKYADDSTMIDFLGYEYEIIESDLSGGDWARYFTDKPKTFRIPFFNIMEPDVRVQLPEAYIVPVEWMEVIGRIKLHGVEYKTLAEPAKIKINTCKFSNAQWRETPYEGRHPVQFEVEPLEMEQEFLSGSLVIDMNQRAAKVVAQMLEPKGPDSFVQWGFFDAVFERKEYVEGYVMEERARLMLVSDDSLKAEFEGKMQSDSAFAADPRAILNWFYQKSPYWDKKKDIYPLGRIMERDILNNLKFE